MFRIKNRVLVYWLSEVHSKSKEKGSFEIIRSTYSKLSESYLSKIREKLSRIFMPHYKKK